MDKPVILICNDDGYFAAGLQCLREALAPLGRVIVVAPNQDCSGSSHKITINTALRLREVAEDFFTTNGSPVDCVHLAIHGVLAGKRPDLLFSGINHGLNLGEDTAYSGTVAAAYEGFVHRIPALAISTGPIDGVYGFENASRVARALAAKMLAGEENLREALWNVNVPGGDLNGVRFVRLDKRSFKSSVVQQVDPRGQPYYWLGPYYPRFDNQEDTDYAAYQSGYVAITPLRVEMTDFQMLSRYTKQDHPFHEILDLP